MKPDVMESSEEEWEEVEDSKLPIKDEFSPSKNVEVTVDASSVVKKKRDWEREMVEASIRRAIKRYNKDTQLDIHKVHLLCLLVLGMRLNKVCNDQELLATVFSLLPERYTNQKQNYVSAIFLTRFLKDFRTVFQFDNGVENLQNCGQVRQPRIRTRLLKVLECKEMKFRMDLVLENASNISTSKAPARKRIVGSKRKSADDTIQQVDGPNDSPPKRVTRSRLKTKSNLENKPPKKDSCHVKKSKDKSLPLSDVAQGSSSTRQSQCKKPVAVVEKSKQEKPQPGRSTAKIRKLSAVDETPVSKSKLETKIKKKLSMSSHVKKQKGRKISDEPQSEEEFAPLSSSDSGDSDFEVVSKTKKTNNTSNIHKSKGKFKICNGNSSTGKPRKSTSRRSTGNLKATSNNSDDAWLEVYSEQERRWLSLDVFRIVVNHPKEMEKYATRPLHYVLGFDSNNYIKDITARYASKWLTETRKLRVGIVDKDWWKCTLAPYATDDKFRDEEENKAMQQDLLSQPMPTAIGAFKNHPLFALRRHLLKFEAIYPPDIPALGLIRGEEILPRSAIHTLHTRDKWLQEARVVRDGEEPYKMVASLWINMKLKQDMSTLSMPLFGVWQTEPYVPPVAENGKVPRNQYGNVDLFKPEMMPVGCVQVSLPGIQKIARKLNIDAAAAITGFDSHGGYPHPVTDGFIVCEEFEQVLKAAWEEDQIHVAEREKKKREERIYGRWKLLIKGALAKERINRKYAKKEKDLQTSEKTDLNANSGTAWQSKRLQEARNKSKPRKRGPKTNKDENLLPFETETM